MLSKEELQYVFLGPTQFEMATSGLQDDGRRTIWYNGSERITKLDHDTFERLAS